MAVSGNDVIIVRNLRGRWPAELERFSDEQLAEQYRWFGLSDWYGNNDERFLEWMEGV